MSLKTIFASAFHLGACCLQIFCSYYFYAHIRVPNSSEFPSEFGQAKFLTLWNVWVQAFVFGLSFLVDIVPCHSFKARFGTIRDYIFTAISFPLCLFVSVSFWGLYAIDRKLIFPEEMDQYFPSWHNHCMHTAIVIFALIEAFLEYHWVPKFMQGLVGNLAFVSTYLVWILYLGWVHKIWVYPILSILSPLMFTLYNIFCYAIMIFFYGLAHGINARISGTSNGCPMSRKKLN